MALFGIKKKEETKPLGTSMPVAAEANTGNATAGVLADVLRNPRITEKASIHMSGSVYTFDVAGDATKRSIMQAVAATYKVHPRKVRIVTLRRKVRRNARTGRYGMTGGGKKAYVYLKKGETITIS